MESFVFPEPECNASDLDQGHSREQMSNINLHWPKRMTCCHISAHYQNKICLCFYFSSCDLYDTGPTVVSVLFSLSIAGSCADDGCMWVAVPGFRGTWSSLTHWSILRIIEAMRLMPQYCSSSFSRILFRGTDVSAACCCLRIHRLLPRLPLRKKLESWYAWLSRKGFAHKAN